MPESLLLSKEQKETLHFAGSAGSVGVSASGSAAATATLSQAADRSWNEEAAAAQIHVEQLQRVEQFNDRAARLGIVIGVPTPALTGPGILHQIDLGSLLSQGRFKEALIKAAN
jgi:hypothetical protein